jgi:hypothetical protein
MQAKREEMEHVRGAAAASSYVDQLKGDSDYSSGYVKFLGEEIAAEEKRKTSAKGTDDEDLVTA